MMLIMFKVAGSILVKASVSFSPHGHEKIADLAENHVILFSGRRVTRKGTRYLPRGSWTWAVMGGQRVRAGPAPLTTVLRPGARPGGAARQVPGASEVVAPGHGKRRMEISAPR